MSKDDPAASKFLVAFRNRTRQAREAAGLKQHEIAELLGMDQPKYSKYEIRSLLPHYLVGKFCLATRISPDWLFTAKGRAPMAVKAAEEPNEKPVKKAKSTRKARKAA